MNVAGRASLYALLGHHGRSRQPVSEPWPMGLASDNASQLNRESSRPFGQPFTRNVQALLLPILPNRIAVLPELVIAFVRTLEVPL